MVYINSYTKNEERPVRQKEALIHVPYKEEEDTP
jgi:hypothetical protein